MMISPSAPRTGGVPTALPASAPTASGQPPEVATGSSADGFVGRVPVSLREMSNLTAPQWEALWTRSARLQKTPLDTSSLSGPLKGLAGPLNDSTPGRRVRAWNRWRNSPSLFLWGGKTVRGQIPSDGSSPGYNRLFEGALNKVGLPGLPVFPFDARVAKTAFDDESSRHNPEVVFLDYGKKTAQGWWQNRIPGLPVSAVHDELRKLDPDRMDGPQIWIGKAALRPHNRLEGAAATCFSAGFGTDEKPEVGGPPKLFVYFALSNERDASSSWIDGAKSLLRRFI